MYREECSARNGVQDGSCASGFGVCCVCKNFLRLFWKWNWFIIIFFLVVVSCGAQINDNCSYIVQSSFTTGVSNPCTYTICPAGNNICRIRYDFTVNK